MASSEIDIKTAEVERNLRENNQPILGPYPRVQVAVQRDPGVAFVHALEGLDAAIDAAIAPTKDKGNDTGSTG